MDKSHRGGALERSARLMRKVKGTLRSKASRRPGSVVEKKEESNESATSKVKSVISHHKKTGESKKKEKKSKSNSQNTSMREKKPTERKKEVGEFSKSIDMEDTLKKSIDQKPRPIWIGDNSSESFRAKSTDIEKLREEYTFLESFVCNKSSAAFDNNRERNRNTTQKVFDENRVVLNRPGHENLDYINASFLTLKDFHNKIIVTQLPKMENESFVEDFWYMIYQEKINFLFILNPDDVVFKTPTKLFIPKSNEYQYVGKMFINTRRVESSCDLRNYTVEVLPEGNSDSVMCQVHQYVAWPHGHQPKKFRLILNLIHEFLTEKEVSSGNTCVMSTFGSGRACSFMAALVAISQLNKGIEPNIFEILKSIKQQRQGATETFVQYLAIYQIVLDYIRRKVSLKETRYGVARLLKQMKVASTRVTSAETTGQ